MSVARDADDLPDSGSECTSIRILDEDTSVHEVWVSGEAGTFLGVGFLVTDSERALAESILGHPCDGTVCMVLSPKTDPLTAEQLATMCRIEAELGPQYSFCTNESA